MGVKSKIKCIVCLMLVFIPAFSAIKMRNTFEEYEGTTLEEMGWTKSNSVNGVVRLWQESGSEYQTQSHGKWSIQIYDPNNNSYANAYKTFTNSANEYMIEFYLWIYHTHETIDSFPLCVLWNMPALGLPEKTDIALFLHESGDSFLVYLEDSAGIQQDVATIDSTDRWYKIQIYRYVSSGDTVVTLYLDGDSIDTYVPMNKNKVSNKISLGTTQADSLADGEVFYDDVIITDCSETEYGSHGVSVKIRTMIIQIQNLMTQINNYDAFNRYFTRNDVFEMVNLANFLDSNFNNLSRYEKLSYSNELVVKIDQIKLGLLYGNLNEVEKGIVMRSLDFIIDTDDNTKYNQANQGGRR